MGDDLDGAPTNMPWPPRPTTCLPDRSSFPHSNPAVVISRHLNSAPPTLADARAELADLDAALTRALAKNPAER